ncbi:hypothetical protein K474DRAFT_581457 [Panus rudis PR-1116 ss-1]|nr:hypothetical protein K474DRAFT_581457 [Panus rudis PR-1116 ss-1]
MLGPRRIALSLPSFARLYSTPAKDSLAGTVAYHEAYILLHTRHPPTVYPKRVPSKLQRNLQFLASQWGGIVNHSWSPEQPVHPKFADSGTAEWDAGEGQEAYYVTAFSRARGRLELPEVTMDNLEEVNEILHRHATPSSEQPFKHDGIRHLYVCTHAERDCRCGETGGQVYDALRSEVARRGLANQIKVGAVAHVGGHKYAGNLLVYPDGEWLGQLHAEHVSGILDALMERQIQVDLASSPLCPPFWRGRMGLDKEEQLNLIASATSS